MSYDVQIKQVAVQPVLSVRASVHGADLERFFAEACDEMREYLKQLDVRPAGPPLSLWHSSPEESADGTDIETCLPVEQPVPARGRMRPGHLPAGLLAYTLHHGSYSTLGKAFEAVWSYIHDHGYTIAGPPRDIILVGAEDTSDPGAYCTEIVWPVHRYSEVTNEKRGNTTDSDAKPKS